MAHSATRDRSLWFFVSDLHGDTDRYRKLFVSIRANRPAAVLLGGDLLPSGARRISSPSDVGGDFIEDFLAPGFEALREEMKDDCPRVLLILGNDDPRIEEAAILQVAARGTWEYVHGRKELVDGIPVYGYSYVPPTPFHNKDWERYDVSRFVDPGCVPPDEGYRSVSVPEREMQLATIKEDLQQLIGEDDTSSAVFLFHSPPYKTMLDRAALDGMMFDYAPLDVHVGSIAIRRLIEARQPAVTMHGHVHESARLTGAWLDRIGSTVCISAAHDGPELALVRMDPRCPEAAERILR